MLLLKNKYKSTLKIILKKCFTNESSKNNYNEFFVKSTKLNYFEKLRVKL